VAFSDITGAVSGSVNLQAALDLKATLESPTFTTRIYTPAIRNILNTDLVVDAYNDTGAGTHFLHNFNANDGRLLLATNGGGLTFPDATTQTTAGIPDAPSNGSQYAREDAAWSVIIPGDRYLTTSTTSNTVSNGNKTFTIGTGLSYTPTQNLTISYDASNHMHGEVLTYNSGTGVLTVDINHHTGSGTYTSWVVNVGGVTPATSVAWGDITGTLSTQTDLQTALDLKAPLASPALTGNVTITTNSASPALIIVQDGAGDVVQFKDVSSDTTYSFINASGKVNTIASTTANAGLSIAHGVAPTSPVNGDIWTTTNGVFIRVNSTTQQMASLSYAAPLASPLFTGDPRAPTPSTGDSDTSIATTAFVKNQLYLTAADAVTTYYPLSGNPSGFLTSAPVTSVAGYTGAVTLANTDISGFGTLSVVNDAPIDGSTYGRNNGAWAVVSGGGGLTISTLSNAATSTLAAAVPTAGQALTYDGTDLIWATVSGSAAWGAITGTLSTQTDLQGELDLKAPLSAPSFTSGITVDATGITFSDSTVQTTAIATGPAGANGLNGTMNYLDIVTMTSSANPSYYESGGSWSMYYGFMNTSAGWFYGKLNASGVDFKLYINGVYDNTVNAAYNYYYLSGTLVGAPVSGDVVTVFISDGTGEATFPILTYTY
jgi:hypothetical protein